MGKKSITRSYKRYITEENTGAKAHPPKEPRYVGEISLEEIEKIFQDCDDFDTRTIRLGGKTPEVILAYIDGVVSGDNVSKDIIQPLTNTLRFTGECGEKEAIEQIFHGMVYSYSVKRLADLNDLISDLVNGHCAVIFPELKEALTFEVKSGEKRGVGEPTGEQVLKGAKDGFVETLRVNTALVRKKIKNADLKIKQSVVGRQTQTGVAVVYIEDVADANLVAEVERRLQDIDEDGMLATGNLEDYIVDNWRTPLPQMIFTERTDKFCINLLEGRVGIFVDGLPIGYLVPGTFAQFMKAPEDYTQQFILSSAITLLRYLCLLIAIFLPAVYVAIAMHHQEMIPTELMQSVISSKQDVPFSTPVEVLGMLVSFELLQEASIRLPNPVGQTVGMIGALIVGQSAVEAKVISPLVVIVIAVAGIAGYTVTDLDLSAALRLSRLFIVVAALVAGMYGITIAAALMLYHMSTLESFGVAYLTPFVGDNYRATSKAVLRWPLPLDKYRERALHGKNTRRQK